MYRHDSQAVCLVAIVLSFGYAILAADRVTIRTSSNVIMAGGAIRVTCRVPRHPENRKLTIGLHNYRESQLDLEGEYAPVTHEILYDHIPCETDVAYCIVEDGVGRGAIARQNINVAGCDR